MEYKRIYVAPAIQVVELMTDGMICVNGSMNVTYEEEDL